MYFFVVIFALVSLLQDEKIKTELRHYNKTWSKFYKRVKKESKTLDKEQESLQYEQKFLGKN